LGTSRAWQTPTERQSRTGVCASGVGQNDSGRGTGWLRARHNLQERARRGGHAHAKR